MTMTKEPVFNTDQTAAHIAAFDHAALAGQAAHMMGTHGMNIDRMPKSYTMEMMHFMSHGLENLDRDEWHPAHLRQTCRDCSSAHSCHEGPLCKEAAESKYNYCEHTSCQAYMHDYCNPCMFNGMDEEGQADPVLCEVDGWTFMVECGSNSGFAGEGVWWETWACGHGRMESGEYTDA